MVPDFRSTIQLLNEDRPKIIDVRARRPRLENIADRIEGGPAVIAVEKRRGIDIVRGKTRNRSAIGKRPGIVFRPVDPIRIRRKRRDTGYPSIPRARDRRNSLLRPPLPLLLASSLIVTVVSPPEKMMTGFLNGRLRTAISRAIAACTRPTALASPSIASERMKASTPAAQAASDRRLQ